MVCTLLANSSGVPEATTSVLLRGIRNSHTAVIGNGISKLLLVRRITSDAPQGRVNDKQEQARRAEHVIDM